ncbi:hypothetical protein N9Z10_04085 [Akkermansiaceae bacterium]|nr:hypothetical protein [Akkermansiaceae bacterium]MDA9196846.1 hypothetical protein [Akkermansiaceae bacterium]MDB4359994.1 hypothetical protein [Akkermansiaceae bacterium]MDB4389577.1 hypothetical protein [Akkermansiaceae bacterium]MDB4397689.1 hypothetical protein [Akkermansiaceae bacterium]
MNKPRFILFIALLGGSGLAAYLASSREPAKQNGALQNSSAMKKPQEQKSSKRSEISAPLPLDNRKVEEMDSTNYEVTVSNINLEEVGRRIERESQEQLRKLTDRYQLTANQRREAFPLLVSYHADYTDGLIVNGFKAQPPRTNNLSSELYLIFDLTQQEIYQEDVEADNKWWGEILGQLRSDLDRSLYSTNPEDTSRKSGEKTEKQSRERVKPRTIPLDDFFRN